MLSTTGTCRIATRADVRPHLVGYGVIRTCRRPVGTSEDAILDGVRDVRRARLHERGSIVVKLLRGVPFVVLVETSDDVYRDLIARSYLAPVISVHEPADGPPTVRRGLVVV